MAQSGFTPIQLYRTDTAAAVPLAANLVFGELALNYRDGNLFFKDNSNVVRLLASTAAATGTVASVQASGGTTGLTFSGGPITTSGTLTLGGTLGVANGGTGTGTALTAGSVVFAGPAGVYTQDSVNFFWDDVNNRLGVGTNSPVDRLTTVGTSEFGLGLTATVSSAQTLLGNFPVALFNNSSVVSGTGVGHRFQLADTGGTLRVAAQISAVAEAKTGSTVSGALVFQTGGLTERMRIDASGNVTIAGSLTLGAALALASGGTGATTAAAARANLSAAARGQVDQISGFIAAPTNKLYRLVIKMAYAGTITETTTRSASGTCTATFAINGTALGGAANSVSSTEQSVTRTTANTFAAGDDIEMTVSANSACVDLSFTIAISRTLA